jgi:hypothetical protein
MEINAGNNLNKGIIYKSAIKLKENNIENNSLPL